MGFSLLVVYYFFMNNKLLLSINKQFLDKLPLGDKRVYSETFVDEELTLSEFIKCINEGYAFSYQFNNKNRNSKHFKQSNITCVDIDEGYSLKELLEADTVKNYSLLVYTTPSHTEENPRFRVVFYLETIIESALEMKYLNRSLSRLLDADLRSTDGARMFFGSRNGDIHKVNKILPSSLIEKLIKDGSSQVISDTVKDTTLKTPTTSELVINENDVFKTSDGFSRKLKEIKGRMSVFCPYHNDRNASAFIGLNSKGVKFLYCSSCQMTRWEQGYRNTHLSTNHFEKELLSLKENGYSYEKLKEVDSLEPFMKDYVPSISNIEVQNSKYLKIEYFKEGILFIKSPKGSGKTTVVSELIKEEQRKNKKLNILLIGHRRSLISHLCERFGLNNYLTAGDSHQKGDKKKVSPKWRQIGICLDSLNKTHETFNYDLVIIDEIEQVLNHFLSDTLSKDSVKIFNTFGWLLFHSKSVICMDADLSWSSVLTISKLCSFTAHGDTEKKETFFLINTFKEPTVPIHLHQNKDQLIGLMSKRLEEGKKVFFTSNSKSIVDDLSNSLNKYKLIKVTSDNSITDETQNFVRNIKNEILKYQLVLTSPSMSTGVDITFENNESYIDCIFGVFENRINTHPEIDQQISRVRHPKEIHLFISPNTYNFETNYEVVESDYLNNRLKNVLIPTEDLLKNVDYSKTLMDYLYMCVCLTVMKRSSFNNLKQNFIDYKNSQLVTVIRDDDNSLEKQGNSLLIDGRLISIKRYEENLLNAEPINRNQYDALKEIQDNEDGSLTDNEMYQMRRWEIEEFYRTTITKELIEKDGLTSFREKVRLYERVIHSYKKNIIENITDITNKRSDYESFMELNILKDTKIKTSLTYSILETLPIFHIETFSPIEEKPNKFLLNVQITKTQLIPFINLLKDKTYKGIIENQFDMKIRADLVKKPITQLNIFLNMMGLEVKLNKQQVINKEKVYFYSLNEEMYKEMEDLRIKRRK